MTSLKRQDLPWMRLSLVYGSWTEWKGAKDKAICVPALTSFCILPLDIREPHVSVTMMNMASLYSVMINVERISTWKHLKSQRESPLGMSVKEFLDWVNHPNCGKHYSMGWGHSLNEREKKGRAAVFIFYHLQIQCEQLPQAPPFMPFLPWWTLPLNWSQNKLLLL